MSNIAAMTDTEIVRELCDKLGPTLVAALSGSRTRYAPAAWLSEDLRPEPAQMGRMRTALELFKQIEVEDSGNVARAWFIGANVSIGGYPVAPWDALRRDEFDATKASAQRHIDGTPF